jgi:hypothetical protein
VDQTRPLVRAAALRMAGPCRGKATPLPATPHKRARHDNRLVRGAWRGLGQGHPDMDRLSLVSGVVPQRFVCSNHAAGGRPSQGARQGQTVRGGGPWAALRPFAVLFAEQRIEVGRAAGGQRGDDKQIPGRPAEDQQTEQERQEAGHQTDDDGPASGMCVHPLRQSLGRSWHAGIVGRSACRRQRGSAAEAEADRNDVVAGTGSNRRPCGFSAGCDSFGRVRQGSPEPHSP